MTSHNRLLQQLTRHADYGSFDLPAADKTRTRTKTQHFKVDHDAPQRACKVKEEPELTLQPVKEQKLAPASGAKAQERPKPAMPREPSAAQQEARAQAVLAADDAESKEMARLRLRLAAAKEKESSTREELEQLKQVLAQSKQAPFSSDKLAAAVRAETQQLAEDRDLLAADIEAKDRTIATLREQVDKAKGECKMLKREGQRLLAENARLTDELADCKYDLKAFAATKADQAKLNDLLAESEEEVRLLRAKLGRVPARDNASGRWSKQKAHEWGESSKAKRKRPTGSDSDSDDEGGEEDHPAKLANRAADNASDYSAEQGDDSDLDDSEASGAGSGDDSDLDSDSEQKRQRAPTVREKTARIFTKFNKERARLGVHKRRSVADRPEKRKGGKLTTSDKLKYSRPSAFPEQEMSYPVIKFSEVPYFATKKWTDQESMVSWARKIFEGRNQKVSGGPFKVQAALDMFALPTPGTDYFEKKDFQGFLTYWANWQNDDTDPKGLQGKRHYLAHLLYPDVFGKTAEQWLFTKLEQGSYELNKVEALKGKTNKYLQMIWWWIKHLDLPIARAKNAL